MKTYGVRSRAVPVSWKVLSAILRMGFRRGAAPAVLAAVGAVVVLGGLRPPAVRAASEVNETCLMCHSDPGMSTKRGNTTVSLFVDQNVFESSMHGSLDCTDCHADADPEDIPHPERLEPVQCGTCHDDVQEVFDGSIHGRR